LAWDVIELLRTIAEDKRCSVSQLALAWCAAQPGITAPIIGPRTFEQVEDNLAAANVALEPEDFARIDALVPPRSVAVRYYDRAVATDFRPHDHRVLV
jgi:aryl-alcohol dehydrogenase-like predicted oxidoreductase